MEPVRGTKQALDILVSQGDSQVAVALMRMGREARRLVPSCIGLSLTFVAEDLTFTLVATGEELTGFQVPAPDPAAHVDGEARPEDLLDER
ncbi:MAG: hypothetical protein ACTHOK_07505, partial [Nocardioidaceae bacterium]